MIVAVTGATGHIGANLVRALLQRGHRVRTLVHHNRQALDGLDVEIIKGDVNDPASLDHLVKGAQWVFHLAAIISLSMSDWPQIEAINVKGTHNIVEACLKNGSSRLIHFSSIHAMNQEPLDEVLDEKRSLVEQENAPPYDRATAAGEREVRLGIEQGLDAVILNPTSVIGPGDYQISHMGSALLAMARGKLPALIEGGFDWVDVRDVTGAALMAAESAPPAAKYLVSGHYATVCELAAITGKLRGVRQPRLVCPAWLARGGAPVVTTYNRLAGQRPIFTGVTIRALTHCNLKISHARADRELHYNPRPLAETLKDTFTWFEKQGWLEKPGTTK